MLNSCCDCTTCRVCSFPLTNVDVVVSNECIQVVNSSWVVSIAITDVGTRLDVLPNHHMTTRNNLPTIVEINNLFSIELSINYRIQTIRTLYNFVNAFIVVRICVHILTPREVVSCRSLATIIFLRISIHVSDSVDTETWLLDVDSLCCEFALYESLANSKCRDCLAITKNDRLCILCALCRVSVC